MQRRCLATRGWSHAAGLQTDLDLSKPHLDGPGQLLHDAAQPKGQQSNCMTKQACHTAEA